MFTRQDTGHIGITIEINGIKTLRIIYLFKMQMRPKGKGVMRTIPDIDIKN